MGYVGCATVEELRTRTDFVRVSSAGLRESHPHDVTITRQAPDYSVEGGGAGGRGAVGGGQWGGRSWQGAGGQAESRSELRAMRPGPRRLDRDRTTAHCQL